MSPLPPGLPPEPPWAVGWPGPGSSCSCWNFPSVGFGSCTEKQGGGGWAGQAAAPHRAENESRRASSSCGSAPFLFSVLQLRFQPWPCTGPPGPAGLGQPTRRDTRGQGHPPAGTSPPGMGHHWDRDTTGTGTAPGQGHHWYGDTSWGTGTGAWGLLPARLVGSEGSSVGPQGIWGVPLGGCSPGAVRGPRPHAAGRAGTPGCPSSPRGLLPAWESCCPS